MPIIIRRRAIESPVAPDCQTDRAAPQEARHDDRQQPPVKSKQGQPSSEPKEPARVLDRECRSVITEHPNAIISWFLVASYLYYIHDISILSDGLYDRMAKDIADDYDLLYHPSKHLIDRESAAAGTLYGLAAKDYPVQVRGAGAHLVREHWKSPININH